MALVEATGGQGGSITKDRLVRIAAGMKNIRVDYDDHYRELQQNFMPRRGNFDPGTSRNGKKLRTNDRLLNSKPRLALRTLQSGMMAGMTSPARPWFRLLAQEAKMRKRYAVRLFTDDVERMMRQYLASSGAYNALHVGYGDVGLLGTDCAVLDEDTVNCFVLHQLPPGMFWLGANGNNDVDSLYMEDWLTVEQVVGRFVYNGNAMSEPDWTVTSSAVKNLWDKGNRTTMVHVARMIMPRRERDPYSVSSSNKKIASIWWEVGASGTRLLRDSGYDKNPIIASRWYKEGNAVWGDSPGMDALGDAKMLQGMERDKNEALRRMNRPAMNAPTSMRNTPFSLAAGAVNYTDDQNGMRPAYEVSPPIDQMREDIREVESRIDTAMYSDLFMRFINSDRRQITAREIDETAQEKLIGLGPVVELQHREKIRPLLLGVYDIMTRHGKLPDVPPELDGKVLEIDYISMLAQAQKAISTGGMERFFGFAGNLAGVLPDVLDKLDGDATLDEYAEMVGVPNRIIRDDDAVEAIRGERAQGQQAKDNAELAATAGPGIKAGVEAAQLLSQTEGPRQPAPQDILNRIGVGALG